MEIDVTRPLIHSMMVESLDGKQLKQPVIYEPFYCKKCQKVGHECNNTHESELVRQDPKQQWSVETKKMPNADKQLGSEQRIAPRKLSTRLSPPVVCTNVHVKNSLLPTDQEPVIQVAGESLRGEDPILFGSL